MPPTLNAPCHNCGESRHRSMQGCPARTSKCRNCGMMGHWAKACLRMSTSRDNDRATDQSLVIAPAIVGDPEDGDEVTAIVAGTRVMVKKASIQCRRHSAMTIASKRSHTMQSLSLSVKLSKRQHTQQWNCNFQTDECMTHSSSKSILGRKATSYH